MEFDLTRPNSGRMLDYYLGGSHNFEIDRQTARQVEKVFPVVIDMARESRYLVRRCVEYFHAQGIRTIIDFGSSLPTCENTHQVAHRLDPNIKVVYSDNDPITVAYSQDLLQGTANVIYLQADAAKPHAVLENPLTKQLIGGERRVGILFLNLPHVLSDDQVRTSWHTLYEWAAPGSNMAVLLSAETWNTEPELLAASQPYRKANLPFIGRTQAQTLELAGSWKVTQEGFKLNATWGLANPPPPSRLVGYSVMLCK